MTITSFPIQETSISNLADIDSRAFLSKLLGDVYNVDHYGASAVTDSTAAFNAAIADAPEGSLVIAPQQNYRIDGVVDVDKPLTFSGLSSRTTIDCYGGGRLTVSASEDVTLENFKLRAQNNIPNPAIDFITYGGRHRLQRVQCWNGAGGTFDQGIQLWGHSSAIEQCVVDGMTTAGIHLRTSGGNDSNNVDISRCRLRNSPTLIDVQSVFNSTIKSNTLEGDFTTGIKSNDSFGLDLCNYFEPVGAASAWHYLHLDNVDNSHITYGFASETTRPQSGTEFHLLNNCNNINFYGSIFSSNTSSPWAYNLTGTCNRIYFIGGGIQTASSQAAVNGAGSAVFV